MKGIYAFLRSIGFVNVRPAVYFWFYNFLFTIFIYIWYYQAFSIPAGETLMGVEDSMHPGTFTFLADILLHYKGSLPLVFSLAVVYTIGFSLVSIYASGGIYAVLVEKEKTSFTNLIANSTQNFFAMLKVTLVNLVVLVAMLVLPAILLMVFASIKSFTTSESAISIFSWCWGACTLLFLTIYTAIYDFSRIYKLKDDKNVLNALKKAIVFTFSNKINLLALFALNALGMVILYLFYLIVMGFVDKLLFSLLIFVLYQAFITARYYLKTVIMRAEIRLLN